MLGKLKDYQVIDVFCSGALYKVRHKVTNNIFTWKAYDCSGYSDEKIQNVTNEVKILSNVLSEKFLRYYDTILHGPTKTLYFVLEHTGWQSLHDLVEICKTTDKHFVESYLWHLLLNLARSCKIVEDLKFVALKKCIKSDAIFIGPNGEVRVNCFELCLGPCERADLIHQVGLVLHSICYPSGNCDDQIKQLHYSDDLKDIIGFLTDEKNNGLRADVILYHPMVLAYTETPAEPIHISNILVSDSYFNSTSDINKCDSEKAVELCKQIEPLPRTHFNVAESPVYCNISPKQYKIKEIDSEKYNDSLSPTVAALALELPGYVPRSRKPYSDIDTLSGPQKVSEETLSHQWMSRLMALRQREEYLNQRERDILSKEIVNSPSTNFLSIEDSGKPSVESNGITLPEVITQARENWVSRRRHRRSSSVRTKTRRKSYAYEDLDSSLSADNGDGSMIITATKFTKENMPRRNIFPEVSTRKVHFTSNNPFTESDESVTLTFYEVDDVNKDQNVKNQNMKDITKFKYLDVDKVAIEKRAANPWSQCSPSKQAKTSDVFSDITNKHSIRKTPSKASLASKSSKQSSNWSIDSGKITDQTCLSLKTFAQTPKAAPEYKKNKSRKSLLPFKTPFKFMSSSSKV